MRGRLQSKRHSGGDMFACAHTHDIYLDLITPEHLNINGFHCPYATKEEFRSLLILCLGCFLWWGRHQRGSLCSRLGQEISLQYDIFRDRYCTGVSIFSFKIILAMDSIDPIDDPRVSHCYAHLNGSNYRMAVRQLHTLMHTTNQTPPDYLLGIPPSGYKATIFLV